MAERSNNLDRKDDNLTSKEQTLEQKEQSLSDRTKHIDAREEQLHELEKKKEEELEKIASLTQSEARDIILNANRRTTFQRDCDSNSRSRSGSERTFR